MSWIFDQFMFLFLFIATFFLPGACFLSAVFWGKKNILTHTEFLVFSFATSLFFLDFSMLLLSKIGIPFSGLSLTALALILIAIPFFFFFFKLKKNEPQEKFKTLFQKYNQIFHTLSFSKKEALVFIGIFILTVLIKSVFLWNSILPTSTDLGHHMYWAKKIALTGSIPTYEKINIDFKNESNTLSNPEPIDDFIIGEHLPFTAIALISETSFLSAFPSLFLLFINILTILTLLALSFVLFKEIFSSEIIARRGMIATFLLIGPLWALSSPEAKYVSGGVVGNILGNFLIPLAILALFRAFQEKNSFFFSLAILFFVTLAFTHHLSTLIFLFIITFTFLSFILFANNDVLPKIKSWFRIIFSPIPLILLFTCILFVIFVYTPTYLDWKAIDTAIGSPSKETREGLSFLQLSSGVGFARLGLELVALGFLLFSPARKTLAGATLIGWGAGLIIMTLWPNILFLDIPSNRISTYGTFPAAILSAFAITFLFVQKRNEHSKKFFQVSFVLILLAVVTGGFFDNSSSLSKNTNAKEAVQTFVASSWLAKNTSADEWIVKDHNYIVADSWMKLFFMRDYSYPLSRGLIRRYTDEVTPREQCTLLMISAPNTPRGKACFKSTGTNTVVVNPHIDSTQFTKAKNMSLLYLSDDIAIYRKTAP